MGDSSHPWGRRRANGHELGVGVSVAVMLPVRFLLWFGTARVVYPVAPPMERLGFAVVGTLVSFAIEFIDTSGGGYQHALDTFRMC